MLTKQMKFMFWCAFLLLPAALSACPGCSFPDPGAWRLYPAYRLWPYGIFGGIILGLIVLYACGFRMAPRESGGRKYVRRDTIILTLCWLFCFFMPEDNYGKFLSAILFFIPNFLAMMVLGIFWSLDNSLLGSISFFITSIAVNAGLFFGICLFFDNCRIVRKSNKPKGQNESP